MVTKFFEKILELRKSPNAKQSFMALFLRVFGVGVFFGLTLFLTNYFSPEIFGEYEFSRSVILLLGSIALLGTDQSVLYYAGYLKGKGSFNELFSIYVKMISAIFVLSVVILLVFLSIPKSVFELFFEGTRSYILIFKIVCILFFNAIALLNTEVFRAYDKVNTSEWFRGTFKYLPLLIGALILYYYGWEEYLVDVYLAGFVLLSIITFFMVLRFREKEPTKTLLSTKKILATSYPMAISSMGFFLLLSIDIIILKKYADFKTIAYYSVAIKLIMLLSMIVNTINSLFASQIAEAFSIDNKKKLNRLLKMGARIIFGVSVVAILVLVFFSETILGFFGPDYIIAKNTVYILLIGYFVGALNGCVTIYFNMTGKQKLFQFIIFGAVLLNLILNVSLIPKYGMVGAAVASTITNVAWNLIAAFLIYKIDGTKIFVR